MRRPEHFQTNTTVSIVDTSFDTLRFMAIPSIPNYLTNYRRLLWHEYELYQPFAGPSGLRFNATAGTTYYFAADTKVTYTLFYRHAGPRNGKSLMLLAYAGRGRSS